MTRRQWLVVAILSAVAGLWWALDLGAYLQLQRIQQQMAQLQSFSHEQPLWSGLAYFTLYVVVTALSVPGALLLTLVGGGLFGFWYALLLVSFASTIGASLAFGVSRVLLRDWVQQRFGRRLPALNEGFAKDGAFYLFTLRLVPLFPFFLVNLLMGLLPISLRRFYWVSQLGMLPATAVYVNAGSQLGQLQGLQGIMSPTLILSFAVLGVFPLLAKGLVAHLRARQVYRRYRKPTHFDNNVLVIGAGSAGLVAALIAATVRATVTLVERDKMGGDCLNTGCVPSKALIRSARMADYGRRAAEFGLLPMDVKVDFAATMERVQRVIEKIAPHDSVQRFTELGVNCVQGEARLLSPWEVEVDGKRLSARHIIIASGARPAIPPIPGLAAVDTLTSENLWALREAPAQLLILGAGAIGCELAQAFARLGSQVSLVDMATQILPREDADVAAVVAPALERSGVAIYTGCKAVSFSQGEGVFDHDGESLTLPFDRVLVAVGRIANTAGLGLEQLGIGLTSSGTVEVDAYLRTAVPNILACGDVAGPYQFTHMASHQAWYATVNALFGTFRKFRVDYSVVPWATFTDPEVARVGLNERDAAEQGTAYEITRYDIGDLDRAIVDGEDHGFVKVLTVPGKDRILGVTIVGYHAAELIAEYVMAMKNNIGLNKVLGTIHIYPTLGESNKFVAGEWRKARKPEALLAWAQRYHNWRR